MPFRVLAPSPRRMHAVVRTQTSGLARRSDWEQATPYSCGTAPDYRRSGETPDFASEIKRTLSSAPAGNLVPHQVDRNGTSSSSDLGLESGQESKKPPVADVIFRRQ